LFVQKTAVDEWTKRTKALLEKTPPHGTLHFPLRLLPPLLFPPSPLSSVAYLSVSTGKRFAGSVIKILNREEQWVEWKREGCNTFEKMPKKARHLLLSPSLSFLSLLPIPLLLITSSF